MCVCVCELVQNRMHAKIKVNWMLYTMFLFFVVIRKKRKKEKNGGGGGGGGGRREKRKKMCCVHFLLINRNCTGQHFAMNEQKVMLGRLLRR